MLSGRLGRRREGGKEGGREGGKEERRDREMKGREEEEGRVWLGYLENNGDGITP